MYNYKEYCPISKTASIVCERWTVQIVREMFMGCSRFSEFQKYLPRLSPSLLNARLRALETAGVIMRKRIAGQRGYEYLLTSSGKALGPMITEMGKWGMRWARDEMTDEELNAEIVLRDVTSTVDTSELPAGITFIEFEFSDIAGRAKWYVKIEDGTIEICDENPGHEPDVYFVTTLKRLVEVWMDVVGLQDARNNGSLKITASPTYLKNLSRWFQTSSFLPKQESAVPET